VAMKLKRAIMVKGRILKFFIGYVGYS